MDIRNICLLGHGGSGKTSLVESMLYITGVTDRLGKPAGAGHGKKPPADPLTPVGQGDVELGQIHVLVFAAEPGRVQPGEAHKAALVPGAVGQSAVLDGAEDGLRPPPAAVQVPVLHTCWGSTLPLPAAIRCSRRRC